MTVRREKDAAREENTGCLVVSVSPQTPSSLSSAAVLPCLVEI